MLQEHVQKAFFHFALLPMFAAAFPSAGSSGVAPQPWPALAGGAFSNHAAPSSPDPLVRYEWAASVNGSILQVYELPAAAVSGTPASSFSNTSSAVGSVACSIRVSGPGMLTFDFGVEVAGWLEFDSHDLTAAAANQLTLGLGEYNEVGYYSGYKQGPPAVYGTSCGAAVCTFRLETNSELYEGLRFGFLTLVTTPLLCMVLFF